MEIIRTNKNPIHVPDSIFSIPSNDILVQQIVRSYIQRSHTGTKKQKTRGEVSGTGRKPWPQKGQGRARASSLRTPNFRGGGVTFAARPVQAAMPKWNKKMYKQCIKVILSEQLRAGRIEFLDDFQVTSLKTKDFPIREGLLFLPKDQLSREIILGSRNLPHFKIIHSLNPYDLLKYAKIYFTVASLPFLESSLSVTPV